MSALRCAVAIASLDLFEKDHVLEKLPPKIARLQARLDERVAPLAHVAELRQRGLMVGIELMRNRERREPYDYQEAIGARVCAATRKRGVLLRPLGPVVVLMPPLSQRLSSSTTRSGVCHSVMCALRSLLKCEYP